MVQFLNNDHEVTIKEKALTNPLKKRARVTRTLGRFTAVALGVAVLTPVTANVAGAQNLPTHPMIMVSTGELTTCAVTGAGHAVCFGLDHDGELGDGGTANSNYPVVVKGVGGSGDLSNVVSLSTGFFSSCAVLADTSVVCWGMNDHGQLGDGTTKGSSTPVRVKGVGGTGTLSGVRSVSVGHRSACALLTSGGVVCWGYNDHGQLGDGSLQSSSVPVAVNDTTGINNLSGATQLSVGFDEGCVVLSDASVQCWGINSYGELGNQTTKESALPVVVAGVSTSTLSNVVQVAVGYFSVCALLSDQSVVCWGENGYGQLGNNSTSPSSRPVAVVGVGGSGTLSNVKDIAADGKTACAVVGTNVACWGNGTQGELGNGTTSSSLTPVLAFGVTGSGTLAGATQVDTSFDGTTCALLDITQVRCWGENGVGEIGRSGASNTTVPAASRGVLGVSLLILAASPQAPNVEATPGDESAQVDVSVGFDGGSPITSYSVTAVDKTNASRGGQHVTWSTSPATVNGLTNGDTYVFDVTAINDLGTSPVGTSNSVIPAGKPGAATSVTAVRHNGGLVVRFAAARPNGRAVSNYEVTVVDLDNNAVPNVIADGVSSPVNVPSVTQGDRLQVTIVATNSVGDGPASTPVVVLALGLPGGPDVVSNVSAITTLVSSSASVGIFAMNSSELSSTMAAQVHSWAKSIAHAETSLTVSWQAPASPGRSAVTSYLATAFPSGKHCVSTTTSCVITGLRSTTHYNVTVIARSAVGTSVPVSSSVVAPSVGTIHLVGYAEAGVKPAHLHQLTLDRAKSVEAALLSALHALHVAAPTITVAGGGATNFVGGKPDTDADRRVVATLSLPRA